MYTNQHTNILLLVFSVSTWKLCFVVDLNIILSFDGQLWADGRLQRSKFPEKTKEDYENLLTFNIIIKIIDR